MCYGVRNVKVLLLEKIWVIVRIVVVVKGKNKIKNSLVLYKR